MKCIVLLLVVIGLIVNQSLVFAQGTLPILDIALFGDSLVSRPVSENNLIGKLISRLSDYTSYFNLNFTSYAIEASMIYNIRNILDNTILPHDPDAYILYWDTDVSDVDEVGMSKTDVAVLRANYVINLQYVIQTINATGAFLAVGGPELLGESVFFKDPYFLHKTPMLNDYRAMNRVVCDFFDVPYMDIRQKFLDAIPSWYLFSYGYLTIDGEHENERGSNIVADSFADALRPWLDRQVNALTRTRK